MCRRSVMSFALDPVIFPCNSFFWGFNYEWKSRELPSTAGNLSFRKVQSLQLIQVPELLLHQGWFARCPRYTQQLFCPGSSPHDPFLIVAEWSCPGIDISIWIALPVFSTLPGRPKMKSKVQRPALPSNKVRLQNLLWNASNRFNLFGWPTLCAHSW